VGRGGLEAPDRAIGLIVGMSWSTSSRVHGSITSSAHSVSHRHATAYWHSASHEHTTGHGHHLTITKVANSRRSSVNLTELVVVRMARAASALVGCGVHVRCCRRVRPG
jgi:hypothetical protein